MQAIPTGVTGVREGDILQEKYRVERVLGVGGMGFVVAAHHLQLDEKVAIKSLLPQGLGHPEASLRFEREARAAVKIKSEHVARVLDVARFDDGTPYLVMEYLDGSDLSDWLRTRGPLPVEQAVELVVQACEAIAEAHTLGIVHRDLKPANLFVIKGRDGLLKVKVLDFGIAKSAESTTGQVAMTGTRSVLGSPEYMSPEQFTAPKTVDWRTDIWSIGATLFELLAGRGPFMGDELIQLAFKIVQEPAMRIEALRAVPAGLSLVLQRCLEKDRSARYQDVAELVAALAPFAPSRTQASVERITRIIQEGRAFGLAATGFAQPVPVPSFAPDRTHAATSWPSQHPGAATPTERALGPLVATVPAPALEPRQARDFITALSAIAGVLLILAACAVCAVLWRRPSTAVAAAGHSAPPPSAEAAALTPPTMLPSPLESVAPAPELSSKPPATERPSALPAFRGTRGVTRATWVLGGGVYNGVIHTSGATGYVDVRTVDPMGGPVVIREDLRLQRGPHGWTYVGSNPRYAVDGEPANFFPNIFYLEQGASGAWTIAETCAIGTGMCAHVQSGS